MTDSAPDDAAPSAAHGDPLVRVLALLGADPCTCGLVPTRRNVKAEARYSTMGMFTLLWGVTARPRSVRVRCGKCQRVLSESTDADLIAQHTN